MNLSQEGAFNNFERIKYDIQNAELIYYPFFFSKDDSDFYLSELLAQINWKSETIKIFGKQFIQPRLTAFHSDEFNQNYTYSGLKMVPEKWNSFLIEIKEKILNISDVRFNGVVLNRYRNGLDHIGWHSDDEKSLGKNPTIVSISFGAERRFSLRRKDSKREKIEINLKNGSLLIMAGEMQHYWQHQVPKSPKVGEERVNLTFREFK